MRAGELATKIKNYVIAGHVNPNLDILLILPDPNEYYVIDYVTFEKRRVRAVIKPIKNPADL